MAKLDVIVGRILHVGTSRSDAHCRTYDVLEIETASGRLDLNTVVAAKELGRAIKTGGDVAMSVLHAGGGAKRRCVVLGIHDKAEGRTFVNEEMFLLRSHARKQAILYSVMSLVLVPLGLVFFVLPGVVWSWVVWKSWASIEEFPEPEEIRASVESLPPKGSV